jgi:hypothetical protein
VKSLDIRVSEAKDLAKTGDFYALILLDTERQACTLTKGGTDCPFWGQDFSLDNIPKSVDRLIVQVCKSSHGLLKQIGAKTHAVGAPDQSPFVRGLTLREEPMGRSEQCVSLLPPPHPECTVCLG